MIGKEKNKIIFFRGRAIEKIFLREAIKRIVYSKFYFWKEDRFDYMIITNIIIKLNKKILYIIEVYNILYSTHISDIVIYIVIIKNQK